jgi:predicted DNA-binding protein YlxM (UPF0122 family)
MVEGDPIRATRLIKYFPELSEQKAMTLVMYTAGMSQAEIANFQGVKTQSVHNCLSELKRHYSYSNLEHLKFHVLFRILST